MAKTMLKKDNGIVRQFTVETLSSPKSYIDKKEINGSELLASLKLDDAEQWEISECNEALKTIMSKLVFQKKDLLSPAVVNLRNATSKKDLYTAINQLLDQVITSIHDDDEEYRIVYKTNRMREILANRKDLVTSIMIKKLLSGYYLKKLSYYDVDELSDLLMIKYRADGVDKAYKTINGDQEKAIDEGIRYLEDIIMSETIDTVYNHRLKHLCWENCANAYVNKCSKVALIDKLPIDDYPYITDGVQFYNGDTLESFIVSGCNNYRKTVEVPKKRPR